MVQRQWLTKFGRVSRIPKVATQWHLINDLSAAYRWKDRLRIFKALGLSMRALWAACNEINFLEQVDEIQVPIYLIAGEHDRITCAGLAEAFVRRVRAPHKAVIRLSESGHLALVEEPDRFCGVMIGKVLAGGGKGVGQDRAAM